MNENQDQPYENISKESQTDEEEHPKLREISEEELKKILEDHKKYSWSNHKDGKEADLRMANLMGADLSNAYLGGVNFCGANLNDACLKGATLSTANLKGVDLRSANLARANLDGADLRMANLSYANLSNANLFHADLSDAKLCMANLTGASLDGTNLSGATIDYYTILYTKKIKHGQIGVNGIWAEHQLFDSAALITLRPPGNSMQGPNTDAIIESLKRSRRLHGHSLALVGVVLLIAALNLTQIPFPWTEGITITPDRFGLLAMPISIGLIILLNSFLSDALKGARYIQDRHSAVSVGNFPWALSRYAGDELLNNMLSFFIRFIMSFHPVAYIYFLYKWDTFSLISQSKYISITVLTVFSLFALMVSLWTFLLSQSFQRPILFDRKTEEERKNNIEELTVAVKDQTKVIKDLIYSFKPKNK